MDEAVRAGKVRYPAMSNYAAWQHCQTLWISEKRGYQAPHVSQPMYNLLARGIEQEYLPFCKQFGVSTVVYNPLAGGHAHGQAASRASAAGHAFRREPDVSRPLLASGVLRRGGRDSARSRRAPGGR